MMDPDDKWVWADDEDLSPSSLPLLDRKVEPIVEWLEVQPEATPLAVLEKPEEVQPQKVGTDEPRREIPPSIVKATMLHLEGQLEQAIEELQAGLRAGEPAAKVYAAMGKLQLEMERFEDAAASYREALLREPESESCQHNLALCAAKLEELNRPPEALVKAIELHSAGKIEEAIRVLRIGLEQGADLQPGRGAAEVHYYLAVCLEKTRDYDGALSSFEKAFEAGPKQIDFGIGVGVCLLQLRRFADAIRAFEACLQIDPADETALFGSAYALENDGRIEEAKAAYTAVLERNPAHEEALHNLIGITGEPAYCVNLLALQPDSKAALRALIEAELAAGHFEAAYSAGERLTAVEPESFEAWFNFGIACHGAKRVEQALAAFSEAARINPESFEAFSRLGALLQEQGDLSGAKSAYESALKISPDEPAVLWRLVSIGEQSGAFREAERWCAALAAKAPKSEAVLFQLGTLRYQRGDYAASVDSFRSCIEQRPEWPAAQFNLGLALWKSGDRNEALVKLESLNGSYGPQALYSLALIAAEHEDYQRALEYYNKLTETGERSPELFYNTGLILQNLGRPEDAAQQYREALAVQPDLEEAVEALAQVSKGPKVEEIRRSVRKESIPGPRLIKSR
jgi:tetratricopeptide (TPR) repeat protein